MATWPPKFRPHLPE
jgi:hypothetical protein